jgi:hypothetical protein
MVLLIGFAFAFTLCYLDWLMGQWAKRRNGQLKPKSVKGTALTALFINGLFILNYGLWFGFDFTNMGNGGVIFFSTSIVISTVVIIFSCLDKCKWFKECEKKLSHEPKSTAKEKLLIFFGGVMPPLLVTVYVMYLIFK